MTGISEDERMDRVYAAKLISRLAHKGQFDRQGEPYYKHPETVAAGVMTDDEKIVAYLHDVVEDTDVTEEEIRAVFGDDIADAVALMTHDENESYESYVKRIAENEIARHVKMSDLRHNMDLTRWKGQTPPEKMMKKRSEKYLPAYEFLTKIDQENR